MIVLRKSLNLHRVRAMMARQMIYKGTRRALRDERGVEGGQDSHFEQSFASGG